MSKLEDLKRRLEELKHRVGIVPVEWSEGRVRWLDVTRLPWEERLQETTSVERLAEAIKKLEIRGAPAIGVAAAFGVAMAAYNARGPLSNIVGAAEKAIEILSRTRPTAFNLFWALNRMKSALEEVKDDSPERLKERLVEEALKIQLEDIETNLKIGEHGEKIIENGDTILTHCNAGALATSGYGTALGVIRAAWRKGKDIRVIATETRPLLQGARLTAWELKREGIPFKLIVDSAVGYVMSENIVDKVIVGADRILLSGHVANKIGTYTIALVAHAHKKPFYVAAPTSTIDPKSKLGQFKIELRGKEEVLTVLGKLKLAPEGVDAINPAFDITPPELVHAIVTEKGIVERPLDENLVKVISLR